jgi:hypothetical protein
MAYVPQVGDRVSFAGSEFNHELIYTVTFVSDFQITVSIDSFSYPIDIDLFYRLMPKQMPFPNAATDDEEPI